MHGSTKDRLEELLNDRGSGAADLHLATCGACASEVAAMQEQAEFLRHLRPPQESDPAPGFYARVLQRIEEHARRSIWYGLVYSPFGKRLAYASLSLALLLGLYVMAAEHGEDRLDRAVAQQITRPEVSGALTAAEQRDAVLVNFASYPVTDE